MKNFICNHNSSSNLLLFKNLIYCYIAGVYGLSLFNTNLTPNHCLSFIHIFID